MPAIGPSGWLIQRRTPTLRAGYAADSARAWALAIRRAVASSGSTSTRATADGVQPKLFWQIFGARRALTSSRRFVSSIDPQLDLTSQTSTTRRSMCLARTSIDPRSPYSENVTSVATFQPAALSTPITASISVACRQSRSLSNSAPFHHAVILMRAPICAKWSRRSARRRSAAPPFSSRITKPRERPGLIRSR